MKTKKDIIALVAKKNKEIEERKIIKK